MEMPDLETERLLIRPLAVGDLPAVLAALEIRGTDAEAATDRCVGHGELDATVLADLGQPPHGDWAVVLRTTGELIRLAGLVPAYAPNKAPTERMAKARPGQDTMVCVSSRSGPPGQ